MPTLEIERERREKTRDFIRQLGFRAASLDREKRTVDVVIASETPVPLWGKWTEVLRMDGAQYGAQHPLLDSHDRGSIKSIVGRLSNFRAEGSELVATMSFSEANKEIADLALALIAEGNLTDASVGYRILEEVPVDSETPVMVNGKPYVGRTYVITKWQVKEGSLVAVGADTASKLRSDSRMPDDSDGQHTEGVRSMTEEERKAQEEKQRAADEAARKAKEAEERAEKEAKERAAQPAPTTKQPATDPAVDAEKIRTEAKRAERARQEEIRAIGQMAGIPEADIAKAIDDDTSAETFRAEAIKKFRSDTKPLGGNMRVSVGPDLNVESLRAAIPFSIAQRAGLPAFKELDPTKPTQFSLRDEKVPERTAEFSRLSLMELARTWAESHGFRTIGKQPLEILELVGRNGPLRHRAAPMDTTSDFSVLLENTMNKMVANRYLLSQFAWQMFTRILPANDMRQHNLYSMGGTDTFKRVGESGEIQGIGSYDGKKEVLQPYAWGAKRGITDDVIINDDMAAIQAVGDELGYAAAKTLHLLFLTSLLSPGANNTGPTMLETGRALFNTTDGNLVTSGALPSKTTFDAMYKAFALFTDRAGAPLGLVPTHLYCPVTIQGSVQSFLGSERYISTDAALTPEKNVYAGRITPVFDPWLDIGGSLELETKQKVSFAANTAGWFGFVVGNGYAPMDARFYGPQVPQIRTDRPIGILGAVYEGSIRVGMAPSNWRASYQNDGA